MKKLIVFLLIAVIVAGFIASCIPIKGDVNNDNHVDSADLALVRDALTGRAVLAHPERADLDGDGRVSIGDLIKIRNIITEVANETT